MKISKWVSYKPKHNTNNNIKDLHDAYNNRDIAKKGNIVRYMGIHKAIAKPMKGTEWFEPLVWVFGLSKTVNRMERASKRTTYGIPFLSENDGQVSLALPYMGVLRATWPRKKVLNEPSGRRGSRRYPQNL